MRSVPANRVVLWLILAMLCFTAPSVAVAQDFAAWLLELREEAHRQGISDAVLRDALSDVTPLPRVIALDRHQPEVTMSFEQYLENVVPAVRITKARSQYQQNRDLLEEIAERYEVQANFLVAFWAIESDFGRNQGNFSVISALATLAYDGRRSAYFRGELLDALHILQRGDVAPDHMIGSWAGAMGQAQFMPSVFLKYSVDYDGDGRCDIWGNRADVLASAANYLHNIGWHGKEGWGTVVMLPIGFDGKLLGLAQTKTLSEWGALGVSRSDGKPLTGAMTASLLQPGGEEGQVYAVYPNFLVIRTWNRSNFYATAVGLLADAVIAKPETKYEHR